MKIEVSPSILSADFGKLNEEVADIEGFSDSLHIDVMDGHFVPNISFGAPVYKCIKTNLRMDVHLMIEKPWRFLDDFIKAGGATIVIHEEACREEDYDGGLPAVLKLIRSKGATSGVSIKPKTEIKAIMDHLDLIDYILIMTVEPGFGGQEFMEEMLPKISTLREAGFTGHIAVDGGINSETAKKCAEAGANILIAGSYIFGADNREKAIQSLRP